MVNAGVSNVKDGDIVMEIDSDEVWKPESIERATQLLLDNPYGNRCATFTCRYFITPNRALTDHGTYGNHINYEWRRMWVGHKGFMFTRHEPPQINAPCPMMSWAITVQHGLVFDHYAYATEQQVKFKEKYYGYKHAVPAWRALCECSKPSVDVSKWLPWVKERAIGRLV